MSDFVVVKTNVLVRGKYWLLKSLNIYLFYFAMCFLLIDNPLLTYIVKYNIISFLCKFDISYFHHLSCIDIFVHTTFDFIFLMLSLFFFHLTLYDLAFSLVFSLWHPPHDHYLPGCGPSLSPRYQRIRNISLGGWSA